jgi:hypothetical protein
MASYDDYKYILGNDVNQCGRVRRSKNMHWVHVVGTQYDLVEWTPPDPMNQGLNCPQTISAPPCEICGLKGQCWHARLHLVEVPLFVLPAVVRDAELLNLRANQLKRFRKLGFKALSTVVR